MTARLRLWFDGRSLRERRLILVMLALGAVTLFWIVLILPVTDGLAAAKERQTTAVLLLADTESRVGSIKMLENDRPAALGAALDSVIRTRADAAGFALGNVTAQGSDRVQIGIGSARPGPLIAWIGGLEQDGILVDTLTLSDNGDKTVAAQISLRARGQ